MKSSKKKRLLWILVPLIALIVVGGAGLSWMLSGSSAAPLALKAGRVLVIRLVRRRSEWAMESRPGPSRGGDHRWLQSGGKSRRGSAV